MSNEELCVIEVDKGMVSDHLPNKVFEALKLWKRQVDDQLPHTTPDPLQLFDEVITLSSAEFEAPLPCTAAKLDSYSALYTGFQVSPVAMQSRGKILTHTICLHLRIIIPDSDYCAFVLSCVTRTYVPWSPLV